MPDNQLYTPTDVSTGINSNSEFLLKLDSQQRYDNIFGGFQNPIEYKIPEFKNDPNGNGLPLEALINPQVSDKALQNGLTSEDPNTRELAWDTYNKNLSKDPVTKGVGSFDIVKYEPWQDKFLNDDYGFNPNLTQQENEAFYYKNQYQTKGLFGKTMANTGKFLSRTVVGAALKLGQGVGYVGAMAVGGFENLMDAYHQKDEHTFMTTVADNALSRYLENAEQDFKDRGSMSIYKPDDWDKKGFFSKLTYGSFWSDEVSDGAAFLLSAMIPGTILGKIGRGVSLLAEGTSMAARGARAFQTAVGLENLGDVGAVAFNTVSESAFEASGVFKEAKANIQNLKASGDARYKDLSDKDIDEMAGNAASRDFKANLGILSISNLFENKFFFKPLANKLNGITSVIHDGVAELSGMAAIDKLGEASLKEAAASKFGKFVGALKGGALNPYGRLAFYGKKALIASVMEGFWEENAQLAAERVATDAVYRDDQGNEIKSKDNFFGQLGRQTVDAIEGKDPENAVSIGLGATMGIVAGSLITKIAGSEKWFKGERKEKIEQATNLIKGYNDARSRFLSVDDIYETDENGQVKYNGKTPVINKAKLEEKTKALVDFGFKQLKADQIKDPVFRGKIKQDLFSEYMAAAVRAGLDQKLISKIQGLPSLTKEQIQKAGFDPESLDSDLPTLINRAEDLVKNYKSIYATSSKPTKGMTYKAYEEDEEGRKYQAYLSYARTQSSMDAAQKYNNEMLDQAAKMRPSAFAPHVHLYDAEIQAHNSLTFEEESLTQARNEFKGFNYTLLDDHIKQRLAEIKKQKGILRKAIFDFAEASDKVQEDNGYLSNGGKYTRFDIATNKFAFNTEAFMNDHNASIKRAQIQTDATLNNGLYDQLTDKNQGIQNYNDYLKYLASRTAVNEEADTKDEADIARGQEIKDELQKVKDANPFAQTETKTETKDKAAEETATQTSDSEENPELKALYAKLDAAEARFLAEGKTPQEASHLAIGTISDDERQMLHDSANKSKETSQDTETTTTNDEVDNARISEINQRREQELGIETNLRSVAEMERAAKKYGIPFKIENVELGMPEGQAKIDALENAIEAVINKKYDDEIATLTGQKTAEAEDLLTQDNPNLLNALDQTEDFNEFNDILNSSGILDFLTRPENAHLLLKYQEKFEKLKQSYQKALEEEKAELAGDIKTEGEDAEKEDKGEQSEDTEDLNEVPEDVAQPDEAANKLEEWNVEVVGAVAFITPNKTVKNDIEFDSNMGPNEEMKLTKKAYDIALNTFLNTHGMVDGNFTVTFQNDTSELIMSRFFTDGERNKALDNIGQVAVVKLKDGTLATLGNTGVIKNTKDLLYQAPIVYSVNIEAFEKFYNDRVMIHADKFNKSYDEVEEFFGNEMETQKTYRDMLSSGEITEVPLKVIHQSPGVSELTQEGKVIDRFRNGTQTALQEFRVLKNDATVNGRKFKKGQVVAIVKSTTKTQAFAASSPKISNLTGEVGTQIKDAINAYLFRRYNTKEEAEKLRTSFFKKVLYTKRNEIHIRTQKDPNDGSKYMIVYEKRNSDGIFERVQFIDIGDTRININEALITSETLEVPSINGTIFIEPQTYSDMVRENLSTNLRAVRDEKGDFHLDPVNAYMSFRFPEIESIKPGITVDKTITKEFKVGEETHSYTVQLMTDGNYKFLEGDKVLRNLDFSIKKDLTDALNQQVLEEAAATDVTKTEETITPETKPAEEAKPEETKSEPVKRKIKTTITTQTEKATKDILVFPLKSAKIVLNLQNERLPFGKPLSETNIKDLNELLDSGNYPKNLAYVKAGDFHIIGKMDSPMYRVFDRNFNIVPNQTVGQDAINKYNKINPCE